jgi:hypothetical protein
MKSGRILIVVIVVGWVAAMAVVGYRMMNEDSQSSAKSVNESVK